MREHIVWPILVADGATQMGRQAEGPEEESSAEGAAEVVGASQNGPTTSS